MPNSSFETGNANSVTNTKENINNIVINADCKKWDMFFRFLVTKSVVINLILVRKLVWLFPIKFIDNA